MSTPAQEGENIKFHYHADTDALYIDLSEKESAYSLEVAPGVVLDFDAEGKQAAGWSGFWVVSGVTRFRGWKIYAAVF
ncbi:DUF2283 domain-containing protein [Moorella naiadis (nom. illeg.)]|uniref:DUF2283 domain-containing protein n=1 Tax=Moorella naiadis (nom. illeg.) TaxID=3093670 RepID=UPI003D9C84AB